MRAAASWAASGAAPQRRLARYSDRAAARRATISRRTAHGPDRSGPWGAELSCWNKASHCDRGTVRTSRTVLSTAQPILMPYLLHALTFTRHLGHAFRSPPFTPAATAPRDSAKPDFFPSLTPYTGP